jgi:sporulation protein YlmC with PRC-barrel domain
MRQTEASFRNRLVLSSDGVAIGRISQLFLDSTKWRISSFELKLTKEMAKRLNVPEPGMFRSATLEIPSELVASMGDAVILNVPVSGLPRPMTPQRQPQPVPT